MSRENGLPPGFGVGVEDGGGVRRVVVQGEVDLSNADRVSEALCEAVTQGGGVVADLTRCGFIDSSGVRALLAGFEASTAALNGNAESAGPRFAIAASMRQVLYVLELTGVDRAVPVHSSFDAAARALTAPQD